MSSAGQAPPIGDFGDLGDILVVSDIPGRTHTRSAPPPPAPPERSPVLPLLALVTGLAAAAIWFVGLPQLDRATPVSRTCEVIVLESGKTRCVTNARLAAAEKARRIGRSKQ
jgi:hypothetical protein